MSINSVKFAHWIKGYQGFYEPIVRSWFKEQGYLDSKPTSVSGVDLAAAAAGLRSGAVAPDLPEDARKRHPTDLEHKVRIRGGRIQLDLITERDGLAIGEFKSWAGFYGSPTWKVVENEFVGYKPGLFLTLHGIAGKPVTEWMLVLWGKSTEQKLIQTKISQTYGIPVHVCYLDEIFSSLGPEASFLRDEHLAGLEEATAEVHRLMLGES